LFKLNHGKGNLIQVKLRNTNKEIFLKGKVSLENLRNKMMILIENRMGGKWLLWCRGNFKKLQEVKFGKIINNNNIL